MKSIKYLLLALTCCLLLHCRKATTDVLPPEVLTGAYFPNTQMVKGGIVEHSDYMTIYGHVWDTFPTPKLDESPFKSVESYSGYNRDTLEIITPVDFIEGKTYYIRGYAKDTNDSIFYGQHEISYDPSNPANNPIACFANSVSQCEVGNCTINFDADCSIPENLIVKYKWDIDGDGFTDYSGEDKQSISHTYDVPGTYNIKLEVITLTGIGDDTIRTIQVGESSDMLIACFNMSKTECDIDDCDVSFDASCSQNETNYKWDFDGDGISDPSGGEIAGYTYDTPGTYEIRLIVEDDEDNADTTFQTIQVYDITADFDIPSENIYEGCEVAFTNNSNDATSYLWNFGDGNTSTESNPIHTYDEPGIYTVTLAATVEGVWQDLVTQNITITSTIKFENIIDGGSDDSYRNVIALSNGGYVIVGSTTSQGAGSYDVYLIKTDANGNMLWEKTFGGSSSDIVHDVTETSDGGYVLAGNTYSQGAGNSDVYLIKVDADGNLLWEKTFGGSNYEIADAIIATPDGGYMLAGAAGVQGLEIDDIYLIKVDADGNLLWEKTFGGSNNDKAYALAASYNDEYLIAGFTNSQGAGGNNVYLLKVDANGNLLWEKTFGGNNNDFALTIANSYDGGYVIAGHTKSQGAGNSDVYLIKTDVSGNMEWEKTFGGSDSDIARAITISPDGNYVLTGLTRSYGAGINDVYLLKVDANGNLLWEKTFGGSSFDYSYSIKTTDDCGYVIVGEYDNGTDSDFYLIKTDSEGNAQ